MAFNLKHWRDESTEEEEQETAVKLPRLLLGSHPEHHSPTPASSALPLFVQSEPTSNLSAHTPDNSTSLSAPKVPRMGSSCFSMGQWQELELQALIFRHIMAGAAVPPQLLHLLNKSLVTSSPYYVCNPLHQCYPHYQPAAYGSVLQSGYWGRGAMDPEPGRCRRTDGKKWRCSRDVVAGQKYCERHMHRGRNRSRKPVEIPTSTATANGGGDALLKALHSTTQGMAIAGGATPFSLSGPSPSMDLLNPSRRPSDSIIQFEAQTEGLTADGGGRTLRHFFDDWPRSEDTAAGSAAAATKLSMSIPSDFSLKLGTGNGDESRARIANSGRDRPQLNWGTPWEATNRAAPMGGPLAEALRSSASTSSPTSVLHRLPRSSASETSYVSS